MSEYLQPSDRKEQEGDFDAEAAVHRVEARIGLENLRKLDEVHRVSAVFVGLAARVHEGDGVVSVESIKEHLDALGTPTDTERVQILLRNKGFRQVRRYETDDNFMKNAQTLERLEAELRDKWYKSDAIRDEINLMKDYDTLITQHRQSQKYDQADAVEREKAQLHALIDQVKRLREEIKRQKQEMSETIAKFRLNPSKAEKWFTSEGAKLGISLDDLDELMVLTADVPVAAVRLDSGLVEAMDGITINPNDDWFQDDPISYEGETVVGAQAPPTY